MDLAQELERAIPAGPPLPPPEARTLAGRAALRRRRVLTGLATTGAVAALAVPVVLGVGGTATRGQDPAPPASRPTVVEPSRTADARPRRPERDPAASYEWGKDEVVAVDNLGGNGLLIRPGAVVLERREDLYPGKDTESVALRLRYGGQVHWEAWEWDRGGSSGMSGGPDDPFYSGFDDFVAKATSGGGMTGGTPSRRGARDDTPERVRAGVTWNGSELVAGGVGQIVEQRASVPMPADGAGTDGTVAAAYVDLAGTPVLVLHRDDGDPQLISVDATGHGDSLGELLAWARQRYRSGAGLL